MCIVASSHFQLAQDVAHRLGMQAFPLIGKFPFADYHWQEKNRQTPGVQDADPGFWQEATGYALMALPGSDLYVIDCDSAAFQDHLFEALPELRQTRMVHSGLPGHSHLYARLSLVAAIKRLQLIEDGTELASLRGHGSYVVGPGSIHPETGELYRDNSQWEIVQLDLAQSKKLLGLFKARDKPQIIYAISESDQSVIDYLAALFRERGYRQNGEWVNGCCIYLERHQHNDTHPSFGFNTKTGGGNCFVCGGFSLHQVAAQMNVLIQPQPFAFQGTPDSLVVSNDDAVLDTPGIQVELNVAAELIRRGCFQVARFFGILSDHARQRNGQHTYDFSSLVGLGQRHQLSVDQVKKSLSQMVKMGLLIRQALGIYRRVGLEKVRALLNLGRSFAPVVFPRNVYGGQPKAFSRAVLLAVEHYLPEGLSTRRIASAAGIGSRTVYLYENELGVQRTTITERIGLARATVVNFVKIFDAEKRFFQTLDNAYDGCKVAARIGGSAWGWQQMPSKRSVPILQTLYIKTGFSQEIELLFAGEQQTGRQDFAGGNTLPPIDLSQGESCLH